MIDARWKKFLEKALRFPFSSRKKSDLDNFPENELIFSDSVDFHLGPRAFFLFNVFSGRFTEMDASIKDISGIAAEEFIQREAAETIMEMAEKSHIESIAIFIKKSFDHINSHSNESGVSANIEHNIISRDGKGKRILLQYSPTGFDKKGVPLFNRGCITDITHIRNDGIPKLYLFRNNQLVQEERADPETIIRRSDIPLSKTEIGIIQLISEGLIAKEIADRMQISVSTLYTHRKNIKTKMGRDITRIISSLKEKGIICKIGAPGVVDAIISSF
jgi:DNA-binding CsgD family transcriptional regulator/PAS domain-containing protein